MAGKSKRATTNGVQVKLVIFEDFIFEAVRSEIVESKINDRKTKESCDNVWYSVSLKPSFILTMPRS